MIWNGTLRFLIQQYAPIIIACGINCNAIQFNSVDGKSFSSGLSIIILGICFYGVYASAEIIRFHRATGSIDSEYFKERYGCLTEGLRTSCFIGAYWNIIVMIRWTLTTIILIYLRDFDELQILFLLFLSIYSQGLQLSYQPLDDKNENIIGVFIEFMVSAYLYVLLLLTDFWGENLFRELVGTSLVAVVSMSITVNFAKLAYNILKGVKEYLRQKRIAMMRAIKRREQEELY